MARTARSKTKAKTEAKKSGKQSRDDKTSVCALPPVPEREFASDVNPFRMQLIRQNDKKWVNETVLRYYFFDRSSDGPNGRWVGPAAQQNAVRKAFDKWKKLPIGLEFKEVQNREDAEIRIGFDQRDGSWSYVGRDILKYAPDPNERTMNFGWDLTTSYGGDTALHEIGHTLGFPHEHQNPIAGIVWNEAAVYDYFRGPPNRWTDGQIDHNILRKLPSGSVTGSNWDPDSVMHYGFGAGLIDQPDKYRNGLTPAGGLSAADIKQAKIFYPGVPKQKKLPELVLYRSRKLSLSAGQQADFRIEPDFTRNHTIQTFGETDSVMVLFEEIDGEPRYVDGDDDSGYDGNARIEAKLQRGSKYILRIRLYYGQIRGNMAVFMW